MKSRWTTYLLLTAVVAVWGIVIWKIFTPANTPASIVPTKAEASAPASDATDTLRLNYPDPFLKDCRTASAAIRPAVRALPAVKKVPVKRDRVKLEHLGTVVAAGRPLYIVTIGNNQFELGCGELAGEFVLTACDGDSLYLRKGDLTYGVKCCDR